MKGEKKTVNFSSTNSAEPSWEKIFSGCSERQLSKSDLSNESSWETLFYEGAKSKVVEVENVSNTQSEMESDWENIFCGFSESKAKGIPTEKIRMHSTPGDHVITVKESSHVKSTKNQTKPLKKKQPLPASLVKIGNALESIWANISVGMEGPPLILLFTSSRREEGTTFVSYHLALYLAVEHSLKTLYVDCDFNKKFHSILKNKLDPFPGLADYFSNRKNLDEVVISTDYSDFYILPSGVTSKQVKLSKILFEIDRLKEFVLSLRKTFDVIIMDSVPVLSNPEILRLAKQVDQVVLVSRYRASQYEVVELTVERLRKNGVENIGAVLNDRYFPVPERIYKKLK
ncbi:MAG: CpsD/CapB family tyrosine-protein kinase [Nitrososphaerota archaeon]